jgi:hypothetical protein
MWELHPKKGISTNQAGLSLGDERSAVREKLGTFLNVVSSKAYPNEDDFKSDDTFIRVRYDEDEKVEDIEFLEGNLSFEGVLLHANTEFEVIESTLSNRGFVFRDTEWLGDGKDCIELAINIATREDVGGDGDDIEWVILSKDFID